MNRMDDLLVSAANNLKEGMDPMHHQWLVDNSVTYDECMTLCEQMATAIHVYRAAFKVALRLSELEHKEDRSLQEIVEGMAWRNAGPMGIILEASRLEDDCPNPTSGMTADARAS